MRHKKTHILGRYSAYLTENITMLLILLVIVSVGISSFMKVQTLKRESREQLMADITAQNLIEYGKATQIRYEDILMNLGAEKSDEKYYFYYDNDWKKLKGMESYAYIVEIVVKEEQLESGALKDIQVNVYRVQAEKKRMIYSLSAKAY